MARKPVGRNRHKNSVTTKSGKTLKVNSSFSTRAKVNKAARAAKRAEYLSTLPKDRLKRLAYRMHPRRVANYWFSREGGIMTLKIVGLAIVFGFFMTIGMFAYFRKDLPNIKDISGQRLGGNITYYDKTGTNVLWQDYDAVKRIPVEDKNISPYIKQATVAIEDKNFFKHGAFDTQGIMRAVVHDVTNHGGPVQGGSTITQQLVKLNEGWTDNRTITRKVKELILAVELEREYSKEEVLTGYLNMAPYGGVEYGVEAAARDYFHTTAKDLTLAQASMLAAIPQAPGYYSPYASGKYNKAITQDTFEAEAMIARQHYILDKMVEQGYIKKAQAEEAKKVDVLAQVHEQQPKYQGIISPYFVLAAKQQLEQTFGATTVQRGGWKVITTLDMDLQKKAEELTQDNLSNIKRAGADVSAMVNLDVETGEVVSQVGGVDFNNPEFGENNYASGIKIPPGSSFKPYDYAVLINNNNNVGAGSVFYDEQGPIPGYPCTNKTRPTKTSNTSNCLWDYDFKYPGPITLRYALGGSRNVPAVKAMLSSVPNDKSTGNTKSINETINKASDMMYNPYYMARKKKAYNCYADEALTQTTQCYGASAIGDGAFLYLDDHVNGLATLARLGKAMPRTYIKKITDSGNREVKLPKVQPKQVIKSEAAYIVNDMASDPKASYLNGSCSETRCFGARAGKFHRYNGWHFAIKTGTTNDGYDGLMGSWSPKYATISWVGNHTRNVTLRSSMENLTAPLTRGWMEYAHRNLPAKQWQKPSGIKTAQAFVVRTHIGYGSVEPSTSTDLYPSWYVGGNKSSSNNSQTIDKVSNKLATSCTPPAAKEFVTNANAASWNIDMFKGGRANIGTGSSSSSRSNTANATDDVHSCSDARPTISLTAPSTCDTSCTVTATVTQGTHLLTDERYAQYPGTVTIKLNGRVLHSARVTESPSTVSFTYTPTVSGSGTLTADVTDSVLYGASDSMSFSYQIPAPVQATLNLILGSHNGNSAQFSWNDIGAGSYTLCYNPGGGCVTTTDTSKTITGLNNGDSYSATVTGGTSTSNTVNLTQ